MTFLPAFERYERKRNAASEAVSDQMMAVADIALGALRCAARDRALADVAKVVAAAPLHSELDRALILEMVEALRSYPDYSDEPAADSASC